MNKFAWLTDTHLDFLSIDRRIEFYQEISACQAEYVLITGDIANGISIVTILTEMSKYIHGKQIYFVLGNHDYYHSSVAEVRSVLATLNLPGITWLAQLNSLPIITANAISLIGSDSWADGRYGDYARSDVEMNDSRYISDLYTPFMNMPKKFKLLSKMQKLADEDAKELEWKLYDNVQNTHPERDHDLFIVLTHVPPFPEVCKYNRSNSGDEWLPFYSCKATGDVLLKFAKENPDINMLVLCGHTHSAASYQALPNLLVKCGESEYHYPKIQELLEFDINNEPINNK